MLKATLIALLLFLLEAIVFVNLAGSFGWGRMLLVALALFVVGVGYLTKVVPKAFRSSLSNVEEALTVPTGSGDAARSLSDVGLRVSAGLLLVIPGLVSGVAGLLMLLPPVRNLVRLTIGKRVARLVPAGVGGTWAQVSDMFNSRRRVVDVDSVRKDPAGDSPVPAELSPPAEFG